MSITYENTSNFIELAHGKVHYHEVGEGPVLLLIHGSGPGVSGWANYQGNLERFSKSMRCIVIDMPGYGQSDVIEGDPIGGCVTVCVGLRG
jgi:2-hydroxy-6-oxonona-2,4-dienedioate hydrolase